MTRPAAMHATKVHKLAYTALKALGFVNLNRLLKRPLPLPFKFTTELAELQLEAAISSPHHLQISVADWDIMFCAIQSRLSETVGDRPKSEPAPQADDTAGHIQVVVLECILAMDQLHKALTHERNNAGCSNM